jgi:hypothetical protein
MFKRFKEWLFKDELNKLNEKQKQHEANLALVATQQEALNTALILVAAQQDQLQKAEALKLQEELDQREIVEKKRLALVAAEELEKQKQDSRENSSVPWVEITGEEIDPNKGIKIELDWNSAFIKYLRDNGFDGADDETVVGKWMVTLYGQMISSLTEDRNFYE